LPLNKNHMYNNIEDNSILCQNKKKYAFVTVVVVGLILLSTLNLVSFLHPTLAILISTLIILVYIKTLRVKWSTIGLQKVDIRSVFWAFLIALIISIIFFSLLIPLIEQITKKPLDYSLFYELTSSNIKTIIVLPIIWVTAAFCEEIIFRGFLITISHRIFQKVNIYFIIIASSLLFGFAHSYQGVTGIIVTFLVGIILSLTLIRNKYNLTSIIFIHGFIDTSYLLIFYFNLEHLRL